jgi:hypothetical protein
MSRKRRSRRPQRSDQKERKGYPSPTERERIVERRDKLLRDLIPLLITPQCDDRKMEALIWRYGPQEVSLVLERFQQRAMRSELIGDEAATYRECRRVFAGFGGNRPFLSWQEYSDLSYKHGKLNAKRTFSSLIPRRPSARERELRDLLLIDAFWDDVTPPDVPPRPADFTPPPAGTYGYPARTLLDWGWNLDDERAKNNAGNVNKWRPAVDDLVRMALDEGLLDGWPGEPSSWAPYHALNVLGYLRPQGRRGAARAVGPGERLAFGSPGRGLGADGSAGRAASVELRGRPRTRSRAASGRDAGIEKRCPRSPQAAREHRAPLDRSPAPCAGRGRTGQCLHRVGLEQPGGCRCRGNRRRGL